MKRMVAAALVAMAFRPASAQTPAPGDDHLRAIALRVTALETRRQLASATPATIDSLLALYGDSVVYEHPNARAVIRGKEALRRGMAQYLGSIRAVVAEPPRVTIGAGVAIVESSARMEIADGGKWIPVTRHGIRVIEFDAGGLVRRIIDYPW
jgi:SnoaL-like domain